MKTIIKLLIICMLGQSLSSLAQTTAIPDENFEQALIDLNIDSDGIINGQVLTADISDIVELNFENVSFSGTITDLTGIEGFSALEILDFHYYDVNIDISQNNIFSYNTNLREIIMMNECADCSSTYTPFLDLSGLPNLELLNLTNVIIQKLKLNNQNFDLSNLTLNLHHEGFLGNDWTNSICIEVANPQAATNNQFPYNTWNIIVNEFTTSYSFGENCTLSTDNFEDLNALSVYPNPVQDQLWLKKPTNLDINKAEVYTISGQLIKTVKAVGQFLDVTLLKTGVYFVKLYSAHTSKTFKVLKQ